jgi:hypothetical protein
MPTRCSRPEAPGSSRTHGWRLGPLPFREFILTVLSRCGPSCYYATCMKMSHPPKQSRKVTCNCVSQDAGPQAHDARYGQLSLLNPTSTFTAVPVV